MKVCERSQHVRIEDTSSLHFSSEEYGERARVQIKVSEGIRVFESRRRQVCAVSERSSSYNDAHRGKSGDVSTSALQADRISISIVAHVEEGRRRRVLLQDARVTLRAMATFQWWSGDFPMRCIRIDRSYASCPTVQCPRGSCEETAETLKDSVSSKKHRFSNEAVMD
jgi:hypothetical protein